MFLSGCAALCLLFFCGLVFRNKANTGQTVTARLKERPQEKCEFCIEKENIFRAGVSTNIRIDILACLCSSPAFSEAAANMESMLLETFRAVKVADADYWACLLACLLAFVCVCAFDAAMSLLLSCLGAATRADLGQTLRVTVTFKNNLPLSRKDRQCICHFLRLSIPFALCKPSMQLSPKGKKDKDIYVPTHLSISIFLSLTRSCGYYAGETHAHARNIWHRITHAVSQTPLSDLSAGGEKKKKNSRIKAA